MSFISELGSLRVEEIGPGGDAIELYGPTDPYAEWHRVRSRGRLTVLASLLVDRLPRLRVLDLGANPYILTFILARLGADVVASGFPSQSVPADTEVARFSRPGGERVLEVPLRRFNVAEDVFPFEDGAFDAVICGELIEHLPSGPHHLFMECNRVLKTGGRLLLSVPNAVSLARVIAIVRGANPEWPFSDQGIYARHNRNYTFAEVNDLLVGHGFRPFHEQGLTYGHEREWYANCFAGSVKWAVMGVIHSILNANSYRLRRFAEGVVVGAEKVTGPRDYRPGWLYGSADTVPMVAAH